MEVKCGNCGKTFDKFKSEVDRSENHYCSRACYLSSGQHKTGEEVECGICGSLTYKSGSQLKASKSGKHFCSNKCAAKFISISTKSNHNVVCNYCGTTFRRAPSTIKEKNYCSRGCWKSDIKSNGYIFYKKFKGKECERCGFLPEDPCQLDVHHSDKNKENNEEDNLKTLCANCHRLVHHREDLI